MQAAMAISEGLARNAICAKVNGELVDLSAELKDGDNLEIVTLKDKEGKTFTVDTDSVILSVGYNPAPVVSKGSRIHVIGDADKVGNLRTVIWGAWNVAMKL